MRAWPPDEAVHAAVNAASGSPCAKSKRGVCVYREPAVTAERAGQVITLGHVLDILSVGYNRQPSGACDGVTCRPVCGRVCVHAEMAAIRNAVAVVSAALGMPTPRLVGCEALHVKVVDDQLVPGGGPSCWQCSREVLDVGLDAFWLFEDTADGPMWVRYTAESFHSATLAAMAREDAVTAARDADQLKVTVQARQAVADVVLQRDEARKDRDYADHLRIQADLDAAAARDQLAAVLLQVRAFADGVEATDEDEQKYIRERLRAIVDGGGKVGS